MEPSWPGLTLKPLGVSPASFDMRWCRADQPVSSEPPKGSVHDWVREHIIDVPPTRGRWYTPDETLSRKAGACIDKAILTRAFLLKKGANPANIYVVVGNDQLVGEHAVVWFHGEVLDSLARKILTPKDYGGIFEPEYAYGVDGFTYSR